MNNKTESKINYIKSKAVDYQESIDFYKDNDIQQNMDWCIEQVDLCNSEVNGLKMLDDNNFVHNIGPKVRVTTYKDKLVIETINPEEFDPEFSRPILGCIGCTISNVSRLQMSNEAVSFINKLKHTGDDLGGLSVDKDNFGWIGPTTSVIGDNCTLGNTFTMTEGFEVIENVTSQDGINASDEYTEETSEIDYKDIKHNLWVEIRRNSIWSKGENGMSSYKHLDDFIVTFIVQKTYFGDKETNIVNAPEGTVKPLELYFKGDGGREVGLEPLVYDEFCDTFDTLFKDHKKKVMGDYSFEVTKISLNENDLLPVVRKFVDQGFENNISPNMESWRLVFNGTGQELINSINKIKF